MDRSYVGHDDHIEHHGANEQIRRHWHHNKGHIARALRKDTRNILLSRLMHVLNLSSDEILKELPGDE